MQELTGNGDKPRREQSLRGRHYDPHHVVVETETIVMAEDSDYADDFLASIPHRDADAKAYDRDSSDDEDHKAGAYDFGVEEQGRRRSIAFAHAPSYPDGYRAADRDREFGQHDGKYGR